MDLIVSCNCSVFISLIVLISFCRGISGASIRIINSCNYTIWPGIRTYSVTRLDSTGFKLAPGGTRSFQAPANWTGRFWGRTGCTFDQNNGEGSCVTGDCGSNQVECNGAGGNPPVTLAEFSIPPGSSAREYFYDLSLVDGYNLPMVVDASGGSGACTSTGCVIDLNQSCPAELRFKDGVACNSACQAFNMPQYCCTGAYSTPATCEPTNYSKMFKAACPRAYSYAYDDDSTSMFTCTGADYTITFCPSSASQKSAGGASPTTYYFSISFLSIQ
ncbi:thaumatin-like protein 1 isoform X2 [Alnus glutinosa]|uniref:thaumatin-like protein 1 isoform X2 n=1 Tax=Alnus glutinosa TaxID=3517 RepID=UPI002D76B47A|nr:thaumatin-like protein 1 isoform X2 [Alnus glutinosa]